MEYHQPTGYPTRTPNKVRRLLLGAALSWAAIILILTITGVF